MEEGGNRWLFMYYVVRYTILYERILYFVSLMIAAMNTHTHSFKKNFLPSIISVWLLKLT